LLAACALVLMLTCVPLAAVFPADYVLFQPQPYLDAVEQSGFYQTYPQVIYGLAVSGGELTLPGVAGFIQTLFPADKTESVRRFIFPENWVRAQVERAVRGFWAYYNFGARDLRVAVDFRQVKTRLQGEDGRALVSAAFMGLAECSAQDLLTIARLALQGKTDEMPRCRPPRQVEGLVYGGLQLALEKLTGGLPDEVVLMRRSSPDPLYGGPGGIYTYFRNGLRFIAALLVMLLAAAIVLMDYSVRRVVEWAGMPLYAGGILAAVLASGLGVGARWMAGGIAGILPGTARIIFGLFSGMALTVFQQFLAWMGVAGVILALVGLVAILVGRR
ncbi:MAG TPA: hypothetical protein PJ988_19125, partial [Anaerolinea sp.]|nr:hypothetical protein [Anaerolinea sp.]